jgi:hypothetical protein
MCCFGWFAPVGWGEGSYCRGDKTPVDYLFSEKVGYLPGRGFKRMKFVPVGESISVDGGRISDQGVVHF